MAGESIIGASVFEEGNSSNGTISDIDGKFVLTVSPGAKLMVSYVGYTNQVVAVKAGVTHYRVTLKEDAQALSEVVVVGYGTQKKVNLTGSVASVGADDISAVPSLMAVIFPFPSTVAIAGLLVSHVIAECSGEISASRANVSPATMLRASFDSTMLSAVASVTVTSQTAVFPPQLASIVAEPMETPLTRPDASTVATALLPLSHAMELLPDTVAFNRYVSPTCICIDVSSKSKEMFSWLLHPWSAIKAVIKIIVDNAAI